MKVTGKNVVVFVKVGADWKLYACATSASLTLNTDIIETSVSGNGKFASFLPTKNSFTGELDGVTTLDEDSMLSLSDLRAKQIAQEILLLKFQRTAGTSTYISQGNFIITESNDTGDYNDMNVFKISLQGTGDLSENIGESTDVPFDYYYGSTDIDTVVDPGAPTLFPSESDFIDSVDDVFTASDELTATAANTGDNITIASFGGVTSDRVKFLQVPAAEAPFLFWSEVGNPFQQNQPIDASFNILSGNVWFKTDRDGDSLYMTYVQTYFTGAIIFSR
jgi:predicted secreted protein